MFRSTRVDALMRKFNLGWVVVNHRNDYGDEIIIIAPYFDGSIPREEVLKKRIPFKFILMVKLLHPRTPVVVRGLITREEIDREHQAIKMAWQYTCG